jgi:hypothetical protein
LRRQYLQIISRDLSIIFHKLFHLPFKMPDVFFPGNFTSILSVFRTLLAVKIENIFKQFEYIAKKQFGL